MTKFILLVLLCFCALAFNQNKKVDKIELNQIYRDIISADSVEQSYFIVDSINHFENKSIVQSGVKYFIEGSELVKNGIWNDGIFDGGNIISHKYLDSIAVTNPRMEIPAHYSFSLPYFSKDKKSFIIYYDYYCGSLCAEYSLRLYKKRNGKWTYIKSFFRIVS